MALPEDEGSHQPLGKFDGLFSKKKSFQLKNNRAFLPCYPRFPTCALNSKVKQILDLAINKVTPKANYIYYD